MRYITVILVFMLLFVTQFGCNDEGGHGNNDTKYSISDEQGANGIDFIIDYDLDRDIRVLQLTDLQLQDLDNARNQNRYNQLKNAFFSQGVYDHDTRAWQYVDEAVEKTNPDLIVLTGDNIYGETDDDGSDWKELCDKMDSYKTPWLCVFGNHDNESGKGVSWQIEQLKKSDFCVFKAGNVTGNSNYNVLVSQKGEARYLFYLFDTNGCTVKLHNPGEALMPDNVDMDKLMSASGIFSDQIAWATQSYYMAGDVYGEIDTLMFFHIPPIEASYSYLYSSNDYRMNEFFDDGENFGIFKENFSGFGLNNGFYYQAYEIDCKGMFVGHQHKIATSIVYNDIRITYGLKTGTYDYHDKEMLGSTLIKINEDGFNVEYVYSTLIYPL